MKEVFVIKSTLATSTRGTHMFIEVSETSSCVRELASATQFNTYNAAQKHIDTLSKLDGAVADDVFYSIEKYFVKA